LGKSQLKIYIYFVGIIKNNKLNWTKTKFYWGSGYSPVANRRKASDDSPSNVCKVTATFNDTYRHRSCAAVNLLTYTIQPQWQSATEKESNIQARKRKCVVSFDDVKGYGYVMKRLL